MRRVVQFMHISLDGYVNNLKGEMDWIIADEEIFDMALYQTNRSDTAIYGRKTFEIMEAYWPTAADKTDASKHDIEHSGWYKQVEKIVISNTLKNGDKPGIKIVNQNVVDEVKRLKKLPGKDIVLFGSPTICSLLVAENVIDDYWLFINPILLGSGKPLFTQFNKGFRLELMSSKAFASGVVCNHYQSNTQ